MAVNQLCESEKLNGNISINVYSCTPPGTHTHGHIDAANTALTAEFLHNFHFSFRHVKCVRAHCFKPIQWPIT